MKGKQKDFEIPLNRVWVKWTIGSLRGIATKYIYSVPINFSSPFFIGLNVSREEEEEEVEEEE